MNKILIVDDERSIRRFYHEELTEEGYNVSTLGDGSRLLEIIEQKRPDLIVLDIKLGEYDGLELLQDIRNSYYDVPVILCSAYSNFKYDLRSIAADYYVVKRENLGELKLKIRMAMKGGEHLLVREKLNDMRKMNAA